jgi:hypothetical protein
MVYVYKNFFIVEREEKIQKASQLVHELKASFNDDEHIWRAKSPLDKVVLVYKHPLINDDNVRRYGSLLTNISDTYMFTVKGQIFESLTSRLT